MCKKLISMLSLTFLMSTTGIAIGQVGSVDDPLDMADSSGDIQLIQAWVDEGNLHLTMTMYGVFAPSVEDTPAGMTNRYYYHWILDTDNNPDTGYFNDQYEGNPTNLETPIGVDVLVQFGWRDGATNGVYAYTLDPLTGDEVGLFEGYEYTIDGDTIHAVIPLEDLGLELGQTIAVSGFQEGASNDWQVDWVESFELTLGDTTGQVGSVDDPLDMADSSGDIQLIQAWVDEGNLNLTMTVYGVIAPSVADTPAGMTNRYYYHWLLDTDNNPDTGYLNDQYEGNPTNLETPIGVDVLVQFGWRDGATNGVYAYTLDPLTGDEVELFEDYEYTIDGDTIHAVIPLEDIGLELGQTIAVSGFQEGASNDWQVDWVESFELILGDTTVSAYNPNPEDGAILTETWANLSWTPDRAAVSHDVYFGDNYGDVASGTGDTFRVNQGLTYYVVGFPGYPYPDGLVPGTTYYWRIDEVNEADPRSPWKGDVWSFSIAPKTAYNPDPADGAEFVATDAILSWTPGFGAKLHTVYIGTDYDTVDNAAGGTPQGTATYQPASLEEEKVYYWRIDESDPPNVYKGDVWGFTTPGAAGSPQPANGAAGVSMTAQLSWTPATTAVSHDVYFGADKDAVMNATTASPEYKGNKASGSESLDPGKLVWHSDYYWRVDAVYSTGTVKGLVWSFTTADFITVDDFESYNDIDPPDPNSNRIFESWIDGFGTTDNGALVGNELPPYADQRIVHGGNQSMPYFYDNNLKTSEATLTLVYPRDWTEEGVTKLSLWSRGSSANSAEKMYIALNGNAVVYNNDPAATQKIGWKQWVIDLSAFTGVDLTNVDTITIGIGTKGSPVTGGTGTMFFDDIRLIR